MKLVDFDCCLPGLLGMAVLGVLPSELAAPLTIVVAMSVRSCPAVQPTDRDRAAVRLCVAELHKSPNSVSETVAVTLGEGCGSPQGKLGNSNVEAESSNVSSRHY